MYCSAGARGFRRPAPADDCVCANHPTNLLHLETEFDKLERHGWFALGGTSEYSTNDVNRRATLTPLGDATNAPFILPQQVHSVYPQLRTLGATETQLERHSTPLSQPHGLHKSLQKEGSRRAERTLASSINIPVYSDALVVLGSRPGVGGNRWWRYLRLDPSSQTGG